MAAMTPNQAVTKYGGVTALAVACGVTRQTVYNWIRAGAIPPQWEAFISTKPAPQPEPKA